MRPAPHSRAGFTLAEVMVTLMIVSIGLLLVTQGLTRARFTSAETHYRKVARELALLTLGELESGLFWEELDGGDGDVLTGTYAEEGYEAFSYELVLGDQEFLENERDSGKNDAFHDSWQAERDREERQRQKEKKDEDEDEDEVAEAFEKVRIKVTYPRFGESRNTLVLERWIPWEQVYGAEEGEDGVKKKNGAGGASGEEQP